MEGWQKRFVLDNLRQLNENIRCSTLFTAELLSNRALATEDEAELVRNKYENNPKRQ